MLNDRKGLNKYALVLILFALSMITYVDRVCISGAKNAIAGEMRLSDTAMGLAFSAFALGYAVAQIPGGWLADRFGPRLVLTCVVSLWSVLTALTGSAWNLASLVTVRFLFGIAEAGAFPGGTRDLRLAAERRTWTRKWSPLFRHATRRSGFFPAARMDARALELADLVPYSGRFGIVLGAVLVPVVPESPGRRAESR